MQLLYFIYGIRSQSEIQDELNLDRLAGQGFQSPSQIQFHLPVQLRQCLAKNGLR